MTARLPGVVSKWLAGPVLLCRPGPGAAQERARNPLRRAALVASWAVVALFAAACALEVGIWRRTEEIRGPFVTRQETPRYIVPIGHDLWFQPLLDAGSDDIHRGARSDLRLAINGQSIGNVRKIDPRGATHWSGYLYFELPNGVPNDASTVVTAQYSVRFRPAVYPALAGLVAILACVWSCVLYASRHARRPTLGPALARALLLPFRALTTATLLVAAGYFALIAFGAWSGEALPTATAFKLHPVAWVTFAVRPYLVSGVVAIALAGAAASWLGNLNIIDRRAMQVQHVKLLRYCGTHGIVARFLPLAVLAAILLSLISMMGWAGRYDPSAYSYINFFGLLPHSDARGYLETSFLNAVFHVWQPFGARRPLAQGLRDFSVLISGLSYVGIALLQSLAIAVALWWAAHRLMLWRGPWAALLFIVLVTILARPFAGTTNTEPLSLFVSLITIPFVVDALQHRSEKHAAVALFGLTLALLLRLGSLFTIPALIMWGAVTFGRGKRFGVIARLAAGIAIAGAAVLTSVLTGWLYAPEGSAAGGNFSWTLCGLSLGGDWTTCTRTMYASEIAALGGDERAIARLMLSKALANISQNPSVFFASLIANARTFAQGVPGFYLSGYGRPLDNPSLSILLVPGVVLTIARAPWHEKSFWLLFWLSVISSASLIMSDDGWRALYATHAIVALFLSFAVAAPASTLLPARRPVSWHAVAVVAAVPLAALTGPLALRAAFAGLTGPYGTRIEEGNVYAGGRAVSGFMVVARDSQQSADTPTVAFPEFAKLFRSVRLHHDTETFLGILERKTPFAFLYSPTLNRSTPTGMLVGPPEMLRNRAVKAWHVVFGADFSSPEEVFFVREVRLATPLEPPAPGPRSAVLAR